jgi:DNA-binding transcriptional regulator GbsR (MarR family)
LARIGGRILGLLMLADAPLGLEEMATALGVSRASISTNIRQIVTFGLAEHLSLPGDRRDYYRFADSPWLGAMRARIDGTRSLLRITEQGLATLAAEDTAARLRLEEMRDACVFMIEEMQASIARWQAHRAAPADHRPRDTQARFGADT